MSTIAAQFEFERLPIRFGATTHDSFGVATIYADRRTWWVEAITAEIAVDGERVVLAEVKQGSLLEQFRVRLILQCGAEIAERMNTAVEEQGGYEILFREAMPRDRFERGRDRERFRTHADVWDLAA